MGSIRVEGRAGRQRQSSCRQEVPNTAATKSRDPPQSDDAWIVRNGLGYLARRIPGQRRAAGSFQDLNPATRRTTQRRPRTKSVIAFGPQERAFVPIHRSASCCETKPGMWSHLLRACRSASSRLLRESHRPSSRRSTRRCRLGFAQRAAEQTLEGLIIVYRQYRHGPRRVGLVFPGGHLEPGEAPLDAARRELFEETGFESGLGPTLAGS